MELLLFPQESELAELRETIEALKAQNTDAQTAIQVALNGPDHLHKGSTARGEPSICALVWARTAPLPLDRPTHFKLCPSLLMRAAIHHSRMFRAAIHHSRKFILFES